MSSRLARPSVTFEDDTANAPIALHWDQALVAIRRGNVAVHIDMLPLGLRGRASATSK